MSEAMRAYRRLERRLIWLRWVNRGHEAPEEEDLLAVEDGDGPPQQAIRPCRRRRVRGSLSIQSPSSRARSSASGSAPRRPSSG